MLIFPSSSLRRSRLARGLFLGTALALVTGTAALAQDPSDDETEVEEVIVAGSRKLVGSVIGDVTPEIVLSPREVRAYGAASVSELLDALSPQTSSGQGSGGRPVVLINGARVSGFAEIRDLPTEAIARVEVLPEEVSLEYGYPAEQKVVNIVLRRRFRAKLAEATATVPTQSGGGDTVGAHGADLSILRGRRLTLDARATHTDPILESDRDVIGGDGAFRTLQSKSDDVTLNATLAKPLGNGVSGTINGVYEHTDSAGRLGRSPFGPEPLERRSKADDGQVSGLLSGAHAGWQWSATAQAQYNRSTSDTDRAFGGTAFTDHTRAVTRSAQSDIVLHKALWSVPAGRVSTTLTARASTTELDSDALRLGRPLSTDLARSIGQLQASFDVPLTRTDEGLGRTIGKLSANLNLNYQHLSDFGDLNTIGYGLHWTPISPLRILASYSRTEQAPTMNQLGDPVTVTPGARVFDLRTGQTVEVTTIAGGSPDLTGGRRDVFKLGVTYKPFEKTNLNFQANFVSIRAHDAIVAFPSASTQVEDAFPDRFVRDAQGVLVQVDARPVNFARESRDELRWGFTYSRPVGPQPSPEQIAEMRRRYAELRAQRQQAQQGQQGAKGGAEGAAVEGGRPPEGSGRGDGRQGPPPDGPPRDFRGGPPGGFGGRGGGRGGGFGGFGGGAPRSGVFQIGLYHTITFKDEALIRPGLPVLDLLDGAALGSGGGSPRHQVDLQANYTRGGLGLSMNAKWQSATRIDGPAAADDLRFSDFTTVNLRLFADLGAQSWARDHRWLRGMRATLAVNNLFDARQEVRTASGVTPIRYQPDLLDPVGRSVKFTVRKLFF